MARLVSDELISLPFKVLDRASGDGADNFGDIIEVMLRAQNELGEGYFVVEEDQVVFLNAAFCRICGYSPDDISTLDDLLRMAEPDERRQLAARYRDRQAGKLVPDRYETTIIHRSGYPVPVEVAARLYPALDGRQRTLIIVRDISERKRHEAEREAALQENARLLGELRRAAGEQRRFLRDILSAVTEDRLVLCESADDLPEPDAEAVEPMALSAPRLAAFRRRVEEQVRQAGYTTEAVYDIVLAASEAAGNAVMHGNGGTARVYADEAVGRVQVWVEDDGPGIALKDLHRAVLERGFTTAGSFGHGFSMMLMLCDRLFLLPKRLGTTVVLLFKRDTLRPDYETERVGNAKTGL
jgi:PAS domain S-box-containing protein